jgi:hypothetical protein
MASFNKFHAFVEYLAEKKIDLANDALKIVLVNSPAPTAADDEYPDLTEISGGNGYTTGGVAVTVSSSAQSSGTYKLVLNDLTITASGGSIGPLRYFVLVDTTPTSSPNKPLIGWWDYGSSITLADGESVTIDFSATNGALQIA